MVIPLKWLSLLKIKPSFEIFKHVFSFYDKKGVYGSFKFIGTKVF